MTRDALTASTALSKESTIAPTSIEVLTPDLTHVLLFVMCNVKAPWKSAALLFFLALLTMGASPTPPAKESDQDRAVRESMIKMARQLGVTCNYCHDVKNFRSTSVPKHRIAKEHINLVDLINRVGFIGPKAPKADCYMCHRGKAIPDYKEPR